MRTGPTAAALATVLLVTAGSATAHTVRPSGHERASLRSVAHRAPAGRRPRLTALPRSAGVLQALKQASARRYRRLERRAGAAGLPAAPPAFAGLAANGLSASDALFGAPPDSTGAIGPDDYVEEVNDGVAVFRRSDLQRVSGPVPNEVFMHSPFPTFVSDPQMQWDGRNGRWLYLAVAFSIDFSTFQPSGPNYLLYGFSKTPDPTDLADGWCHYSLASGTTPDGSPVLDDYPKLGHDDRHLIFGSNVFTTGGEETFVTARIWSVPLPPAGNLGTCPPPPEATTFGSAEHPLRTSAGSPAFTPVPANTVNASRAGYVVAAEDATHGTQSHIMTWRLGGSASAPTLTESSEIAVPPFAVPRPARDFIFPQIDTLDARLTLAVANADPSAGGQEAIWTAHTIDPGDGRVVMRWYELLPRRGAARQVGTVSERWVDVYNGSVSPTVEGSSAVLDFNRSGFLLLPELDARLHASATAPGVTSRSVRLAGSGAPDFDLSCTPVCRWGDYSNASPDPSDPAAVWIAGEVVGPPGGLLPTWTTQIAQLSAAGSSPAPLASR